MGRLSEWWSRRHVGQLLAATALALGATGAPSPAGAGVPKCFGKRATIVGNAGHNRIVGTNGPDVITGGPRNDLIIGKGGSDLICGGTGRDQLFGEGGNDKLDGGDNDDFFGGAGGNDLIVGGKGGRDFAQYLGGPNAVNVDLGRGRARGWGKDRLRGIEYVGGTNLKDHLTGKKGRNALFGQGGDDRLGGGRGRDFLFGGRGDDSMAGGPGLDVVDYTLSAAGVNVDLENDSATGEGSDTILGIEDAWGSVHNDTLVGDSSTNQLYAWDGKDVVDGGSGDDLLVPGIGNDGLDGGGGDDFVDYYYGKLSQFVANTGVSVNLSQGQATGHGTHTLTRIENISGTDVNDELTGNSAANGIFGLNGNDDLFGLAGNDWLDGGAGNDLLVGGSGNDACTTGEQFPDQGSADACETTSPPARRFSSVREGRIALSGWLRMPAAR
ncbi:MAG: calcium-binding protein [Actinomycetota bacterium]